MEKELIQAMYDFVNNCDKTADSLTDIPINEFHVNLMNRLIASDTSYCIDVSRLIFKFLLVPTKREVISTKKYNIMKEAYLKLLQKTNFGFKEYLVIGKVILYFYSSIEKYGANVLDSSYFELPFEKCYCYCKEQMPTTCSCTFYPPKYKIPICSSTTLNELFKFWVEVFNDLNLKSMGKIGFGSQLNINCTPIFSKLLTTLVTSNTSMQQKIFSSFLSVIRLNLNSCEVSFDVKIQYTTDFFRWLYPILERLSPEFSDNSQGNDVSATITSGLRRGLISVMDAFSNLIESIIISLDILNVPTINTNDNNLSNSQAIYLDFVEDKIIELLGKFLQSRKKEAVSECNNYHCHNFESINSVDFFEQQYSKVYHNQFILTLIDYCH